MMGIAAKPLHDKIGGVCLYQICIGVGCCPAAPLVLMKLPDDTQCAFGAARLRARGSSDGSPERAVPIPGPDESNPQRSKKMKRRLGSCFNTLRGGLAAASVLTLALTGCGGGGAIRQPAPISASSMTELG